MVFIVILVVIFITPGDSALAGVMPPVYSYQEDCVCACKLMPGRGYVSNSTGLKRSSVQ